jgi:hypothetical protein
MKYILIFIMFSLAVPLYASQAEQCRRNAGSLVTGVVVAPPYFQPGRKPLKGVQLSHTHVSVKSDTDAKIYDVAIDNVFAEGYRKNLAEIPSPLNRIAVGDHLSLCGQLYSRGVGIHWVHTNCGKQPNPSKPNGWVKKINPNGDTSENYESLTAYCYLWK